MVKEYIQDCWRELWNPDSRVWQYIDRVAFILLPLFYLSAIILKLSNESGSWETMMANLTWIIPLSIWLIVLLVIVPYRVTNKYKLQRDKANRKILELENHGKSEKSQLQRDISSLIIEGTRVMNIFKSIDLLGNVEPLEEFYNWREHLFEVLTRHQLNNAVSLFYKDVGIEININNFSKSDFIKACEKGLNRLEGILKPHGRFSE